MYIIYRIIEKTGNHYSNIIINQDVMEVNNKEEFYEAIKLIYGDHIKFRNTKTVNVGELFVSIISYNCYNSEDYLLTIKNKCSCCQKEFITNRKSERRFNDQILNYLKELNLELFNTHENELKKMTFCSEKCYSNVYNYYVNLFKEETIKKDGFIDEWVYRESHHDDSGYIYMITKKETNEFYVGKTNALPMFRWVQHLKTDRFPLENICDFRFEILEKVKKNLSQREVYWINEMYQKNPTKCLNKFLPKESLEI